MESFSFTIHSQDGNARRGTVVTPHGSFETPAFSPVGTKATVKGIRPDTLKELGAEVVLGNTYHLFLSPGEKLIQDAGGLGSFMNWQGPTITDSGGFQVFSLGVAYESGISKLAKEDPEQGVAAYDPELATQHGRLAIVDDEGVSFTSHLDGSFHRFTPERSVEIQHALGADIFFAFDECTAPNADHAYQQKAMWRTHAWAERSLAAHRNNREAREKQALFGIVQGGRYEDLRRESAAYIGNMAFDGFGIGGSFNKYDLGITLDITLEVLPHEKPKHLLGIGEPEDIFAGVASGIDMFDCVAATRIGRTGYIYTHRGKVNLRNAQYRSDLSPLDTEYVHPLLAGYSKAYVAHLIRSDEMLGGILCSMHNVAFLLHLMKEIRRAIEEQRFDAFREEWLRVYQMGNVV